MIEVRAPDGSTVRFPDGTPDDVIERAMRQEFGGPEPSVPPEGFFPNPETGQMTSRELLRNNVEPSRANAAMLGALQGVGFQFGDEAIGLMGRIEGGPEMQRLRTEQARAEMEANREAYPATSIGGEIGGGVATAAATAPLAVGKGLLSTIGRGAALGAAEGGLFGLGRGEGAEDRAGKAGTDAMIGGLLGGAIPLAMAGFRSISDAAGGITRNMLTDAPSRVRANRALATTLNRSGRSVDDIAADVAEAQRLGQPEFRAVDALGDAGARRASGIARSADESGNRMVEFMETRNAGQADRLSRFVREGFDTGGDTAAERTASLEAARKSAADQAFSAARRDAGPVDVRSTLAVIDDRIGGMTGSNIAGDSIDGKLAQIRRRLAADKPPNGELSRELSDFDRVFGLKQDVGDMIGAAKRAGRGNEARELIKVQKELDRALEAASPAYRQANDDYVRASRVIDAVDEGSRMTRSDALAQDNLARFGQMTPDEQAAARVGYADRQRGRIEANATETGNRARIFNSPKAREEAAAMTVNPGDFAQRIDNENRMFRTQAKAIQNSRTAQNLEDIREVTGAASGLPETLRSIANFQLGDAAATVMRPFLDAAQGLNDQTRMMIAEALLSDNPRKAFNIALKQEMSRSARQALTEGIARSATLRAQAIARE